MKADLLIRGGRVVGGSGAAAFTADVAVAGGKIHSIGNGARVDGRERIDARGLVVAPGFVDIHSHGDLVLAWPSERRLSLLRGRVAQGITTEIVGNCGLGVAPLFGGARELARAINGWMSPSAFAWTWRTVEEYLTHLETIGLPVNVGTLVPHGPLRLGAMGLSPGEPEADALAQMTDALDAALEQGAFGLSTGLIYPPGMYSSTRELAHLASRLARHGAVFTSHIRGSSETLLPAVGELLEIGRTTGVRVHHSHAEAVGRSHWAKLDTVLALEDQARAEGVRVTRDMFPYPVAATMMLAIYPPWSLDGGVERLLGRLRDPERRRRIERDIASVRPEWPPWESGGWPHNLVGAVGWDRIQIATVGSEKSRALEGLSLAELGRLRDQSPFDAISDLMLEEGGNVGQFVLDISGEEGLRKLIGRSDVAFITDANDYGKGKPHPAAYGSFPRILGRSVRQERALGLAEAIRRMSSLPAEMVGLQGRGRLEEGAWADITIFDPERVGDEATLSEPRREAKGIVAVIVNGEVVVRDGALTGSVPGRALRRGEE